MKVLKTQAFSSKYFEYNPVSISQFFYKLNLCYFRCFSECAADQQDMQICASYFDEYFKKVSNWAKEHKQELQVQYPKVSENRKTF